MIRVKREIENRKIKIIPEPSLYFCIMGNNTCATAISFPSLIAFIHWKMCKKSERKEEKGK